MKKKMDKNNTGRIIVNLNKEEFEFVDNIGRDTLFTTGKRLTNNKIIRVFVRVMRQLKISGKGLCSPEELERKILTVLGIERRKYPRFKKKVKLFWRKLESMAECEKGKTIEIGEGGFRIELDKERNVGEILEFTIQDASMPDKPIKAFGRIAWTKNRPSDNVLEAGICLTYLPKEDKERFNRLFLEIKPEESIKNES